MKPDTAVTLLREIVEMLGDRPYQALDRHGPFVCVFCGVLARQKAERLRLMAKQRLIS